MIFFYSTLLQTYLDERNATLPNLASYNGNSLAGPLCNFFNFSLDKGVLPSSYKEANVCPIHKKDGISLVNNYILMQK